MSTRGSGALSAATQIADRITMIVMALGAGALVAMLIYLAGRPLDTNDMWWHLTMGEVYATEGPWPEGDPVLFTAHADAPVQQEWGFSVLTHLVRSAGGFTALRVAHALTAALILAMVLRGFLLAGRSSAAAGRQRDAWFWACGCVALYVTLTWWRLFQLRSDLFSIPATLLFAWLAFRPVLEPQATRAFSWKRVAAVVLLVWVWANVHSLFGIALALLVAALCGALLQWGLERMRPPAAAAEAPRLLRPRVLEWSAMFLLGAAASAIHPRGSAQLTTFFDVSREFAIWRVRDDWLPFDPFGFAQYTQSSMTGLAWALTDGLLIAFIATAGSSLVRYLGRPDRARLERFAPVLFGLGLAGCAAFLVSIRFIWMAFFPIFYVLRWGTAPVPEPLATGGRIAATTLVVALAVLFPSQGGFHRDAADPGRYLDRPYSADGFAGESVRFLHDSDVTGRVFNAYPVGGYMGFWLSPRLRLFIDSRTEHYEPEIVREYTGVNRLRSNRKGETVLGLLDRRGVDFFVGTGLPGPHDLQDWQSYTTAHLDGAPGWVTVFRNFEQQVYLRDVPRNRGNLARIERFWRQQGVPFDPARGFDPGRVIRERPDVAVQWRLVPPAFSRWQAERSSDDEATRITATQRVALALALTGATEDQIEIDRELLTTHPGALAAWRRLIAGLLRAGRDAEALEAAQQLVARADTPRHRRFLQVAGAVAELDAAPLPDASSAAVRTLLEQARFQERNRLLAPLEILNRVEIARFLRTMQGEAMRVDESAAGRARTPTRAGGTRARAQRPDH